MSYRPEGWERDKPKPFVPPIFYGLREPLYISGYTEGVEAGADAILEGLIKGLGCCDYHSLDIDLEDAKEVSGYWVFIPGEKE